MSLVRFGVSLPEDLIKQFDALINRKNYQSAVHRKSGYSSHPQIL